MRDYPVRNYRPNGNVAGLLEREWLVTNGRGGYACGTVGGVNTRRYHGLLTAAHVEPAGRVLMLKQLAEELELNGGQRVELGGKERTLGEFELPAAKYLEEFRLERGLPLWVFRVQDWTIERRLVLPYLQNTVHISYRLTSGSGPVTLHLRPYMHFRTHDEHGPRAVPPPYRLCILEDRYEISAGDSFPALRMHLSGRDSVFVATKGERQDIFFRIEAERGYDPRGVRWGPGSFIVTLSPGQEASFVASTEPWTTSQALSTGEAFLFEHQRRQRLVEMAQPQSCHGIGAELVLAADQFLISPAGRVRDHAWAHAAGDQIRTVIAGYHWFTDWGRDTMISLEGLALTTGRYVEAGWILRTFGHYVREGLLPNLFPEGKDQGLYHTADATLWYFHAIKRYLDYTENRAMLRLLLPILRNIIDSHLAGTRFGIGVDAKDGLLKQGAPGFQLTWMDAKVDDWVVTPRRGKAVEINALWYNALCLFSDWLAEEEGADAAMPYREKAAVTRESFNNRFWYASGGYLLDVVDGEHGDDSSLRPNQVMAISLTHPVLDPSRWESVLTMVHDRLLTPVGLRSLDPADPDFHARYYGDLRSRDAAYHQGTVWAWLIGPFIDAWLKWKPADSETARSFLAAFEQHLDQAAIGTISEIFDADTPHTPRGCVAQAWSVAEVLRCWAKTAS